MPRKRFSIFELVDATQDAIPTILAYDQKSAGFAIGENARRIAASFRPVVQDFKLAIGETDAMFEGKSVQRGGRPQRLWEVRPEAADPDQRISTKQALRIFLQELFKQIGDVPEQLIFGIPATADEPWLTQYKNHVSQVLAELGHPNPQFFPEPFAVFQYYRDEGLIPAPGQPLTVLVIDFGGGTLDSCIIETTAEGNLSRGGATRVPLGIHSTVGAGKAVDRKLVALAISKNNDPRLRQDSPESRIAARPWVLLAAEEMKIALSKKMQTCRLSQDCSSLMESRTFPPNWYHPDVPVRFELNGNDLKQVLQDLWFDTKTGFGRSILASVQDAKFRGGAGIRLQSLDRAILAGGSSGLPFLRELLARTLAGQIDIESSNIIVGEHYERAVAYGIAVEAAEERNRSLRTHNAIGPCVFNELFLYSAPRRRETPVKPRITLIEGESERTLPPGILLPGPMRLGGFEVEYKVELPYRPHGSLIYWFTDMQREDDPEGNRLNTEQDIVRVPPKPKSSFRLKISFDDTRGMITPTFLFGDDVISGAPFFFGGLRLAKDIRSYAGIDFGTSNSYAVKLWAAPKTREVIYPEFRLSEASGARLRKLEATIQELRAKGILTTDAALKFSAREETDFIFQSIKIEGSTLSRGATEDLLSGQTPPTSKESLEPVNVRAAYEFAIAHSDSLKTAPAMFLRELNKLVLRNIEEQAGMPRTVPVKISGMEYQPPDALEVPAMLDRLAAELKAGSAGRSAVQFAAEMHSKVTAIHPFVDGNGRTARLLMNAILLDSGLPAIVISHSDKQRYLDCLAASNSGDISDMSVLLAELMESCLEVMSGVTGQEVALVPQKPQLSQWVPSQELAEIMKKKLANLPVNRRARYEAWCAGFEALREEFRSTFVGFSETYSYALYGAHLAKFDTLPFEKYESLLRRAPASRTWLMSATVSSDIHSERFIFHFHTMSPQFLRLARTSKQFNPLPPTDVTLAVSRWVNGSYQSLREEPVRLREIGYINGGWMFLFSENGSDSVTTLSLTGAANMFLRDAIAAFL
jgi:molecular chaperone DnaK (HSP70)/fido (protein-threonine AMPylation protein)